MPILPWPDAFHVPARAEAQGDVIVVGAGLIGLACAAALADRGVRVSLLADIRRGEASAAAAGMLAPSVERATGAAFAFAIAARNRYPAYLDRLAAETGVDVPINRLGILELALSEEEANTLRSRENVGSLWLTRSELSGLEPALAHAAGAVLHPDDGAVNNLVLMRALKRLVGQHAAVTVIGDAAVRLTTSPGVVTITTRDGLELGGSAVVLAAGAWVTDIEGIPRDLPVEPVRGQMLSMAASPVRHVVYGAGGYIVPRGDGRTYVGSTMERVAFAAETTEEGMREVRSKGVAICPALSTARMLNGWAGLRPVTPDLLPIVGRDRAHPEIVYACGHSRNGVLMAPLTGDCVADLITGDSPRADLSDFDPHRFARES